VTEKGKIVGNVSQMDVIQFLHRNSHQFEKAMKKRLSQVGLDSGSIISATEEEKVIDAFSAIATSSIYGIAIVNKEGVLCGNISATDVKGITYETFWKLELPIKDYLSERRRLPLVVCGPEDTIGEVVRLLAEKRVHRVYVIDDIGKPINVVTLTSIMKVLSPPLSECFT